jgi:hypothetical protein
MQSVRPLLQRTTTLCVASQGVGARYSVAWLAP